MTRLLATFVVLLAFAVAACTGGNSDAPSALDDFLADGTVTDGELERAWRIVAECLSDKGIAANAHERDGRWSVTIDGDFNDADYHSCSTIGDQVAAAYNRERIPEGAERLELADSLRACLSEIGISEVPFGPDTRNENEILAAAIKQLGYEGGEADLAADPRFGAVLSCLQRHELLFPARFDTQE